MVKSLPDICVYTTLHGLQLVYAERLCRKRESSGPFCFRSNKKWQSAVTYLESHESIPLLIRNIEDDSPTLAVTYTANLTGVRFPDDFESDADRRKWMLDALWVQQEFYEEQGRTPQEFQDDELEPSLKAKTAFLISNLRRIRPVPISKLRKADGDLLSANYKYGYVLCRMPTSGSQLYVTLTTPWDGPDMNISEDELVTLDRKYSGTPEYTEKVVNHVRRPSAIRDAIIKRDGSKCRLCGVDGFVKKGGGKYAETHHMIELNKQSPQSLQSWNVIVVCPTCHKMLHFGDVKADFLDPGWRVFVNGKTHQWSKP